MTTLPGNLHIQCNTCQTAKGVFHGARTNDFATCVETQKTPNRWMCQLSCLQTILQSYSHPDSAAQKQKYRPMKPVRKPIGFCVLYFHFHLLQGILDPPFDFFFDLLVTEESVI